MCPQKLLDLGLVFEVAGALALGVIENSLPPRDPLVVLQGRIRTQIAE